MKVGRVNEMTRERNLKKAFVELFQVRLSCCLVGSLWVCRWEVLVGYERMLQCRSALRVVVRC